MVKALVNMHPAFDGCDSDHATYDFDVVYVYRSGGSTGFGGTFTFHLDSSPGEINAALAATVRSAALAQTPSIVIDTNELVILNPWGYLSA